MKGYKSEGDRAKAGVAKRTTQRGVKGVHTGAQGDRYADDVCENESWSRKVSDREHLCTICTGDRGERAFLDRNG